MTLATGGFLSNREKRLYASAYHYWNHIRTYALYKYAIMWFNLKRKVRLDSHSFFCQCVSPIVVKIRKNNFEVQLTMDDKAKAETLVHWIRNCWIGDYLLKSEPFPDYPAIFCIFGLDEEEEEYLLLYVGKALPTLQERMNNFELPPVIKLMAKLSVKLEIFYLALPFLDGWFGVETVDAYYQDLVNILKPPL